MQGLQKQVGARIRQLRERLGLSQEALADVCGLHRTYVGLIERGERNLTLGTLEVIAGGLGVPAAELFEGIETAAPPRRPEGKKAVSAIADLAAHIAAIRQVLIDAKLTDAKRYEAIYQAKRANGPK